MLNIKSTLSLLSAPIFAVMILPIAAYGGLLGSTQPRSGVTPLLAAVGAVDVEQVINLQRDPSMIDVLHSAKCDSASQT